MIGEDRLDVLTSHDSAFRPEHTAFGTDGRLTVPLYVSGSASRFIGHAQPRRFPMEILLDAKGAGVSGLEQAVPNLMQFPPKKNVSKLGNLGV